ncbi:MAG TPA: hypothetical protein VMU22_08680 [Rhizomicrobium sp.]|nr:hypothetical protein [Rhizomicrobium sp.]
MTPTERLARDIRAVRRSYRHALTEAMKAHIEDGSTGPVREVKNLIGSLAAEIQVFIPLAANSNETNS